MYGPDEKLPEKFFSRVIPLRPAPVELETSRVKLVPLSISRDAEALYLRTNGSPITIGSRSAPGYDVNKFWQYLPHGPFKTLSEFTETLKGFESLKDCLLLCIIDKTIDSQVGLIALANNTPYYLTIELRHLMISPISQETGLVTEVLYLVTEHLFKTGYRRVEVKPNVLDFKSLASFQKVGYTVEKIERYAGVWRERNVDLAWTRILDYEWERDKEKIRQRVFGFNYGTPKL